MKNPHRLVSRSLQIATTLTCLPILLAASALSAAPYISEFLADNETGLRDEDGEFTDWLELHNPDPDPIDLGGYFLTDNPSNLTKWEIPSPTVLESGGFLVVFASGKDRAVSGDQLHTNFSIDDAGEYLALVDPGGTVVQEFGPDPNDPDNPYPKQLDDVSYGFEQIPETASDTLVDSNSDATALVPPDSTLGITWTTQAFDDTAWRSGPLGVGYERGSGYEGFLGIDLEAQMFNQNGSVYVRIPFTASDLADVINLDLDLQFDDGFSAYLNGVRVTGANAPVTPNWNSLATAERPDAEALEFQRFSLTSHLSRLQEGENILAIHGLNVAANDEDLLIRPRLVASRLLGLTQGERNWFASPTPGAPNLSQQDLPTGEVLISEKSRTFTDSLEVTLQSQFPGETIRYTTNGSAPSAASPEYTGPLTINGSTQLRARAFSANNEPGPITMESYLRIDPTLAVFSSNLPIVIVDTWRNGTPDGNTQKDCFWAIIEPDPVTGRASMTDEFQLATRAGVKRRGSSSFNWPKYSMTIEARNEENRDKGVKPLGLPRESDWILSGRYQFDRALMRNDLMYRLSREAGEYAVRTRFVELIHNVNGGNLSYNGDYFGVYSLMEKIKRDDSRVDIAPIDRRDSREPDVTGGYIFKKDRLDPGDSGFSVSGMGTLGWVEPKEREVTSAQRTWLTTHLNELDRALNTPSWTHPTTRKHFTEYLDQHSWLRHHWLNTLAMNVDGFRLSGYYYKHRVDTNDGKVGAGPVWDFDRTMGSYDGRDDNARQWDGTGDSSRTWSDNRYPWWGRALQNPDFRQAHTDLWQELRKTVFSVDNINQITGEFLNELDMRDPSDANPGFLSNQRSPAARNFTKWSQNPPSGGSIRLEVRNLQTWLRTRVTWIDQQYTQQPIFSVDPGLVDTGTQVGFTMQSGSTVFYTTDGSDPRLPGGAPSSSAIASTASSPVPATIDDTTIITARARIGTGLTAWSGPVQGTFLIGPIANSSNLAITEVHYAPLPATTAEEIANSNDPSDFEFIELRNFSATDTIDLTGVHFENGMDFTFTGSAVTSLAPGERVLVVRNRAAFEARYGTAHSDRIAGGYAPFRLDNAGERLLLVDGLGNPIAEFRYNDKAPWPADAGFAGYSLVLNSHAVGSADYDDPSLWRTSTTLGGTPNSSDSTPLAGPPLEDADGDGVPKILEHVLGRSDDDASDGHAIFTAAVEPLEVGGETRNYLTVTFTRDLAADDVLVWPEISSDLTNWMSDPELVVVVNQSNQGDGTSRVTFRTRDPFDAATTPDVFLRLRASLP